MARQINKLSARAVQTLTEPGRHSDGGGLYLVIDRTAEDDSAPAKRWVFIYRRKRDGKQSEMGLGGLTSVSLAKARKLAEQARADLQDGIDPIEARKTAKRETKPAPKFGAFAETVIESLEGGWRNPKHRKQWRSTIKTYCTTIAGKFVNEITTEDVLEVLKPIWSEKAETASRLRGRIEKVLDAAKAKGWRNGENPARWRGHLNNLLPKRQRLQRGHHAALPWQKLPAFMSQLRKRDAIAALALEFCILTAARSGEVLGARWDEFDLEAKVWTVPAHRMKAGKEHRVPLSGPALSVIEKLKAVRTGDFVFPAVRVGRRKADAAASRASHDRSTAGRPLSGMAMEMLLRRMDAADVTVHGFRSTFRDWAGEATNFPRELAEAALAHAVGDAVERAYRRGDALKKRRALMEAWARYAEKRTGSNVLPLSRPAS